eukprot:jgi/Picre1/33774/NNA_001253.t1
MCILLLSCNNSDDPKSAVLLRGAAVNQDGRSSSLTAPNGPSQQAVVKDALSMSDLSTSQVDGLQTHGTGTGLGDPIEIGAARACFNIRKKGRSSFTFFASKTSVGHSEPASGLVGLSFLYQAIENGFKEQILHLTSLNHYLDNVFQEGISVPREEGAGLLGEQQWGVSAFAFQGTNAHAVLSRVEGLGSSAYFRERPLYGSHIWYSNPIHPLVMSTVPASSNQVAFHMDLHYVRNSFFFDHKVLDQILFPGAGFLEFSSGAMAALGSGEYVITKIAIMRPCALNEDNRGSLTLSLDTFSGKIHINQPKRIICTCMEALIG